MRRVPEFLPDTIQTHSSVRTGGLGSAVLNGDSIYSSIFPVAPTQMVLTLFHSPALIHGLLMTEVRIGSRETERFFFGYRCVGCEKIYLIPSGVDRKEHLHEFMSHLCDPSEIRRAVRNARHLGLERNEYLVENGMTGEWGAENRRDQERYYKGG